MPLILARSVVPGDYPALETVVKNVVKEKQAFERLVISKENLLKMFAVSVICVILVPFSLTLDNSFQYNKYKVHLIKDKIPDGTSTTVYRCGPMIDLCLGPHIPHTGRIKSLMITKVRETRLVKSRI